MYTIINTGLASDNLGDKIIVELLKKNFPELFNNNSGYFEVGSHDGNGKISKNFLSLSKFCFVTGGNSIPIKKIFPLGNILNIKTKFNNLLKNKLIFIGSGTENYERNLLYSKTAELYLKKVLNTDFMSSTRDIYSKEFLNKLGFKNIIYTGCPTTWGLKPIIDNNKIHSCIFTITSHKKNIIKDKLLLNYCLSKFKKVFCWPQQTGDIQYFKNISGDNKNVQIVGYSLEALNKIILEENISHSLGTRLHGNLFCLNHNIFPIIISIDNRAAQLCKDINLPFLERDKLDITSLDRILFLKNINLKIPKNNIELFKKNIRNII